MKLTPKLLLALAAVTTGATTHAQDWAKEKVDASPRHLEWIDLQNGDRTVKALIAFPEVSEKATVVIMIHEIYGMSDWAMLMADQLAEAGYIVIAPDFLTGLGPDGGKTSDFESAGDVRSAMSTLSADQVIGDLDAAPDLGGDLESVEDGFVSADGEETAE